MLEYRRFKQLEPVCSNLAVIYEAFAVARDEKVCVHSYLFTLTVLNFHNGRMPRLRLMSPPLKL